MYIVIKMIFITFGITIFVGNESMDANWTQRCQYQLTVIGEFNMEQDKTEAFMHAYSFLTVPDNRSSKNSTKGILFDYQVELYEKFLTAHKDHLQNMFKDPIEWYKTTIMSGDPNSIDKDMFAKIRKDILECSSLPKFLESHEHALENMFFRMRNIRYNRIARNIHTLYFNYLEDIIQHFVKYTDARSPSDYCSSNESPAEHYISIDQDGKVVKKQKQTSASTRVVYHDNLPFNFNKSVSSSSGDKLNIDPNE